MTGWLVGIGVPVAAFVALIGSVWHHRGRNTGRHVAPTGTLSRDVYDATMPIAHTRQGPPWDEAPEPDDMWVADLRAALDEVQPSGWVKPELGAILAAPTEPARYGVQFDEQGREVGWLPDPYDMWGAPPELAHAGPRAVTHSSARARHRHSSISGPGTDKRGYSAAAKEAVARCPECECRLLLSGGPHCPRCGWMERVEPSRLADTTDQLRLDLAMDVAGYMVEQDADATRYGEDLAGWCAGQLRALRETLCP